MQNSTGIGLEKDGDVKERKEIGREIPGQCRIHPKERNREGKKGNRVRKESHNVQEIR
jgi:hypothetical protein